MTILLDSIWSCKIIHSTYLSTLYLSNLLKLYAEHYISFLSNPIQKWDGICNKSMKGIYISKDNLLRNQP